MFDCSSVTKGGIGLLPRVTHHYTILCLNTRHIIHSYMHAHAGNTIETNLDYVNR